MGKTKATYMLKISRYFTYFLIFKNNAINLHSLKDEGLLDKIKVQN